MAAAGRPLTASGWDLAGYEGCAAFLRMIAAGVPSSRLIEQDGLLALLSPASPERSLYNSVLYEDPRLLEAAYLDLASAYDDAGIRAWTVWAPEGDRASLALLESRGHAFDGAPRMMGLDLASFEPPEPACEVIRGFGWDRLAILNDAAYGYDEGTHRAAVGDLPPPGSAVFGARWEDEDATALLTVDVGSDCSVMLVATDPRARGKRLASTVLATALSEARERGLRSSSLQASAAGAGLYARLGYEDLGAVTLQERRVAA